MGAEGRSAGDEIPPGCQLIEVHVSELSQLFNSIDPSPFHEKDLDNDAEDFIVSWARELPPDAPFGLLVHLDKPAVTQDAAQTLREAVHGFFTRRSERAGQRLRELFRLGRSSLAIGLVFLAFCVLLGDWVVRLLPGSRIADVARESLLIGGWVAMWRPLEIFLYDWWPIRDDRRLSDRLSRMLVRIVCGDPRGS